jgi:hypothetical protein
MARHFTDSVSQFKGVNDSITEVRKLFEDELALSKTKQAQTNDNFSEIVQGLNKQLKRFEEQLLPPI